MRGREQNKVIHTSERGRVPTQGEERGKYQKGVRSNDIIGQMDKSC